MSAQLLPEMKNVDSSNIAAIGYDCELSELFVQYKNGMTYKYKEVPTNIYESFLKAESKGKFMNEEVKPFYDYDYLR